MVVSLGVSSPLLCRMFRAAMEEVPLGTTRTPRRTVVEVGRRVGQIGKGDCGRGATAHAARSPYRLAFPPWDCTWKERGIGLHR